MSRSISKETLTSYFEEGLSCSQIAKKHGLNPTTPYHIAKAYGIWDDHFSWYKKRSKDVKTPNQLDRVIYKTTNLINGRIYIGKDSFNSKYYLGSGRDFKKDLELYGKDNFKKETLCHCACVEELNERERYWIKHYRDLRSDMYNIKPGAGGGDNITNHPNRTEICKKISERRSNQKASTEARKSMSIAKKGKPANFNKVKVRCVYCNIESNAGNIKRFHNDHCLKNPLIDIEKENLNRTPKNKGIIGKVKKSDLTKQKLKLAAQNRPYTKCKFCLIEFTNQNIYRHEKTCLKKY